MMGEEGLIVNKLNCFFVLMFMSFSVAAEVITLVPSGNMDMNLAVRNAVVAECDEVMQGQTNQPNQGNIGAFQIDLSKIDQNVRDAIARREPEFEVNGQRFVPVMGPQQDEAPKPRLNLMEGDNGFLALSPTGLKFQVGNVSGKVDGKRIKFTVPIR